MFIIVQFQVQNFLVTTGNRFNLNYFFNFVGMARGPPVMNLWYKCSHIKKLFLIFHCSRFFFFHKRSRLFSDL